MKKLFLSLFSIVALAILVVSCSKSIEIEQQETKPSVSKMSTEEKMKWIESIVSKYHQSKGSRVASFCPGNVQFLGDLGDVNCINQQLNIPESVNCAVYSFTVNSTGWAGIPPYNGLNSQINTNIYVIKENGTLLSYGVDTAIAYGIPSGSNCFIVFFKTQSVNASYRFNGTSVINGTSCSDNWEY